MITPFHLAIQVRDIAETRDFYGVKMGLPEGRSDQNWIDWNLFGHQVVTHLIQLSGRTERSQIIVICRFARGAGSSLRGRFRS